MVLQPSAIRESPAIGAFIELLARDVAGRHGERDASGCRRSGSGHSQGRCSIRMCRSTMLFASEPETQARPKRENKTATQPVRRSAFSAIV